MGCALCGHTLTRKDGEGDESSRDIAGPGVKRLCTKWARFEVRPAALQSEHLVAHRASDVHKVALQAWTYPDEPVHLKLQACLSDDRLLSGSVPQVEDWIRAWRAARTPQSWQAAAEKEQTEHFIRQTRQRPTGTRPLEHMALIMREVPRKQKRLAISQATCISLSFDDRGGFKLIRFKCDGGPSLNSEASADGTPAAKCRESVAGIIGCVQSLRGTSLSDFAEDYADRTVKEIEKLVVAFCTPLGGTLDEALLAKFYTSVRSIVADGALQKVAQYLQKSKMPNIVLITRDPAHMLRIAAKDPLVRSSRFGKQHERLFGKKGLLRQVQFSDSLQARLEDCQRIVLLHSGTQGGDLRHVMRHFSFAAHRFESMNEPRRKYACVLHAVVLLLADMAGDSRRKKEERQHAEEILDAMTTQDLLETGLAGDFAECATQALRRFDRSDSDPALASAAIADFTDIVRRLFVDGWIMMEPNEPGLMTLTQIVLEQCSDIRQFRYGERVKVLWSNTTKAECQETLREIATIAADMLDRVAADFGHNDMYMQLEAMDIAAWNLARQQQGNDDSVKLLALRRRARTLHETLRLRWNAADWDVIITAAIRERHPDPTVDNRCLWARLLSLPAEAAAQQPALRSELLVRFYLSLTDGTGEVERLLGRHAAFLARHGPGALSEACVEIATEGPADETGLGTPRDGRLLLTDFSRQCAQLWVALRGRKFGSYKQRSDTGQRSNRRFVGSLRAVRQKTRAAMDNLVKQARGDQTVASLDRRRTIVGHRRCDLLRGAAGLQPTVVGKSLKSFRKTTADRLKAKASVGLWRGFEKNLPAARRKEGTRLPIMVGAPICRIPLAATSTRLALAASQGKGRGKGSRSGAAAKGRAKVEAAAVGAAALRVITTDEDLTKAPLSDDTLMTWLPAIALGKTVEVKESNLRIPFKAAIVNAAAVQLSSEFEKKHRKLTNQLRNIMKQPSSKWREVAAGGATIRDLHGLRSFLVRVQRRPLLCGVAGPLAKPLAFQGGVSRYGRPVKVVTAKVNKRPVVA